MAELITMYMARRELVNAAFNNRMIVCPKCNGDSCHATFSRRTPEGYLIFDYVEPEPCETCNNSGIIKATESNVSKEVKDRIIASYLKRQARNERAKKTAGQTWNRNRIKNDPRFK